MTQPILDDEHRSSVQSPQDIDDDDVLKAASHTVDHDSRVESLERNLRYIQQQHEVILVDLHHEINRLQQENRDLHHQLNNTHSLPSPKPEEKIIEKPIDENSIHLEEKIDELEKQLIESEEKNIYLIHQIDELNKISALKSQESNPNNLNIHNDYQHLLTTSSEKQQQNLQEIEKLRSVLLEILNTERLSLASKILLRDCLTSTNLGESSMSKTTTTPVDMLFFNEKQRRFTGSPSINGKTSSFRQVNSQHRPAEQRATFPTIIQGNSSPLSQHPTDVIGSLYHPLTPTNYSQHQRLIKIGETSVARRERRNQELQRNRLLKNLFH